MNITIAVAFFFSTTDDINIKIHIISICSTDYNSKYIIIVIAFTENYHLSLLKNLIFI